MRETPATKEDWVAAVELFQTIRVGGIFIADADITNPNFFGYRERIVVRLDDDVNSISSVWFDTGEGLVSWKIEDFIINSCKVRE